MIYNFLFLALSRILIQTSVLRGLRTLLPHQGPPPPPPPAAQCRCTPAARPFTVKALYLFACEDSWDAAVELPHQLSVSHRLPFPLFFFFPMRESHPYSSTEAESVASSSVTILPLPLLLRVIPAVWQSLDEGKRRSQSQAGAFMTSSGRK